MKPELRRTHVPVLCDEVIRFLDPQPNHDYVDATIGQGGHTDAILNRTSPGGRVLGIDKDKINLSVAASFLSQFKDRAVLAQDSFANLLSIAYAHGFSQVSGIVFDLGFSSYHIEDSERGFSFQSEGPLDMRYDQGRGKTAEDLVNSLSENELADIFRLYGEERRAREIAKAIINERGRTRIATTTQLAKIVSDTVRQRGKLHPATRVFQALRIAVNNELDEIKMALPQAVDLLEKGGVIVIISFHSLEDRIIKNFFKTNEHLETITKKILVPTQKQKQINPRARSARMR
ncbi:TPA: 16S rRNA (cytosine(1402)-N(4))-methyltransferase, partial [Candidatus Uhrbacteria bacterium]|nr:16S rRNA (cytosine(1402)-N(4))-methyltransferase [Candidatus Uhrbacteria bacterium]